MRVRLAAAALLVMALPGCGSGVQFVRMDETRYHPKPRNAPVAVFDSACREPHVVIGTLTAHRKMKASFNDSSIYEEAVADLKERARDVGADAIMQLTPRIDGEGMGGKVEVEATAIRYLARANSVQSAEMAPQTSN